MSFLKKSIYYCLLAGIVVIAIEVMARVAYYAAWGEVYDGGGMGLPAHTPPPALEQELKPNRVLHPYYGHTPVDFEHKRGALPPRRDDTVIIGALGGSVTHFVMPALRQAVYRYFLDNGLGRRPVVVALASQSGRQPQQVMITADTLLLGGEFDLLVNLDGYNEIHRTGNFDAPAKLRSFPFRPFGWKALNRTAAGDSLVGSIGSLREEQLAWERAAQGGLWRYTAVFGMISRYRRQSIEGQIANLYPKISGAGDDYSLERYGPHGGYENLGEVQEAAARLWYRSSLLLADLAELSGAEYYHFLQPNQYIPNSKPFSREELAIAYDVSSGENPYSRGYPLLAEYGMELRRRGVNYFDLTRIYADTRETIYVDACCHVNERGNELLAAAILRQLEPALRRAALGRDGAAVSGLAAARRPQPADKLLLDGDFRVYRRGGNWLAYVKEGCTPEERAAQFFLHITPVDGGDLPAARQGHGFDNRDFGFAAAGGGIVAGKCVVEQRLPGYPIAGIRTGQYDRRGTIWSGEFHFQE